jgi:PAS domain S-box-containing protein
MPGLNIDKALVSAGQFYLSNTYFKDLWGMTKQPPDALKVSRHTVWSLLAVTLAGVIVTAIFFWTTRSAELNQFKSQFEHDASIRANLVAVKLNQCLIVIRAFQSCYDASDEVERREFKIFTAPFLAEQNELQALAWLPRVLQSQRADFEKRVRQDGLPGFQIKDLTPDRRFINAAEREEYYPIEYVEPIKGNEQKIGFNMASEPIRRAAMEKTRDTGKATVTERIQMMQADNAYGFIIYLPIYKKEIPTITVQERRAALEGFVAGIFRTDDALATAMNVVMPEGISYDLLDLSAPPERQLICHWQARLKEEQSWRSPLFPSSPCYRQKIDFGDRIWEMNITSNSAYMEKHYSLAYWLILPAGFGLTLLLGLYLWAIQSQRTRLERTVLERTAELRRYQENLEKMVQQRAAELRKLSVAVEQSPAITVITDPEGNIEYVNPKFGQTTGYTLEEVRGKNPRILKSGKTTPEEYKELWDAIRSGREWRGEFHNKKKNGEYYWEQALIAPIKNELGRITNFIAIKEDITERKRAEESLKIAHDDLTNANLELKKASDVKSRFLASMSHEIRTPLNAIIGMTGLLLDTKLDAEQREFMETLRTSGEMLLSLINNILEFSKIEAEKIDLENQPFDLLQCVEESLDLVNQRAEEKKLKIGCQMQAEVPPFFAGDVTRLRQILVNLLGNAVKFTDKGSVMVSVSGEAQGDSQYRLYFVVRDTGIGISPDRRDRLFQSFSQVDASTTRRFGGTGLGLAISKRLCELMGGTMWVESSGISGEGAEFHFTILVGIATGPLPRETTNVSNMAGKSVLIVDDNNSNRDLAPTPSDSAFAQRYPLRILLAEDNLINQKVALKMLAKLGYRGDVASNGLEALEAVKGIPYDVILMDCQMPEMDGYEATRQIRLREQPGRQKTVYIIAMTAHAMKGDREECLAAGMNDYLSKPVREAELRAALQRCWPAASSTPLEAQAAVPDTLALLPDEPLLDIEWLKEMSETGTDGLDELIDLYLTQAKEIMADLCTAIAAGRAEDVKQLAHKLAGSSAVCGVKAIVTPLRALEQKGKEGRLSGAEQLLAQASLRLALCEKALADYLQDLRDH